MKFKIALGALLASTAVASAADMDTPYARAPSTSPAYNWTGFYLGAIGGYGTVKTKAASMLDMKGGFAGVDVGYNQQIGIAVIGFEADGAWADITQTAGIVGLASASSTVNAIGTVRGRVGLAFDQLMIYGTGGIAVANNTLKANVLNLSASDTQNHIGWTAGAGIEVAINQNWSIKGEYLYAALGSQNYFQNLINSGDVRLSTAKVGFNYRF